jgi:hypothetical protein
MKRNRKTAKRKTKNKKKSKKRKKVNWAGPYTTSRCVAARLH